ncbi:MAG: hypothetical protein AAB421_00075 [Patescibacteria group bacterium]
MFSRDACGFCLLLCAIIFLAADVHAAGPAGGDSYVCTDGEDITITTSTGPKGAAVDAAATGRPRGTPGCAEKRTGCAACTLRLCDPATPPKCTNVSIPPGDDAQARAVALRGEVAAAAERLETARAAIARIAPPPPAPVAPGVPPPPPTPIDPASQRALDAAFALHRDAQLQLDGALASAGSLVPPPTADALRAIADQGQAAIGTFGDHGRVEDLAPFRGATPAELQAIASGNVARLSPAPLPTLIAEPDNVAPFQPVRDATGRTTFGMAGVASVPTPADTDALARYRAALAERDALIAAAGPDSDARIAEIERRLAVVRPHATALALVDDERRRLVSIIDEAGSVGGVDPAHARRLAALDRTADIIRAGGADADAYTRLLITGDGTIATWEGRVEKIERMIADALASDPRDLSNRAAVLRNTLVTAHGELATMRERMGAVLYGDVRIGDFQRTGEIVEDAAARLRAETSAYWRSYGSLESWRLSLLGLPDPDNNLNIVNVVVVGAADGARRLFGLAADSALTQDERIANYFSTNKELVASTVGDYLSVGAPGLGRVAGILRGPVDDAVRVAVGGGDDALRAARIAVPDVLPAVRVPVGPLAGVVDDAGRVVIAPARGIVDDVGRTATGYFDDAGRPVVAPRPPAPRPIEPVAEPPPALAPRPVVRDPIPTDPIPPPVRPVVRDPIPVDPLPPPAPVRSVVRDPIPVDPIPPPPPIAAAIPRAPVLYSNPIAPVVDSISSAVSRGYRAVADAFGLVRAPSVIGPPINTAGRVVTPVAPVTVARTPVDLRRAMSIAGEAEPFRVAVGPRIAPNTVRSAGPLPPPRSVGAPMPVSRDLPRTVLRDFDSRLAEAEARATRAVPSARARPVELPPPVRPPLASRPAVGEPPPLPPLPRTGPPPLPPAARYLPPSSVPVRATQPLVGAGGRPIISGNLPVPRTPVSRPPLPPSPASAARGLTPPGPITRATPPLLRPRIEPPPLPAVARPVPPPLTPAQRAASFGPRTNPPPLPPRSVSPNPVARGAPPARPLTIDEILVNARPRAGELPAPRVPGATDPRTQLSSLGSVRRAPVEPVPVARPTPGYPPAGGGPATPLVQPIARGPLANRIIAGRTPTVAPVNPSGLAGRIQQARTTAPGRGYPNPSDTVVGRGAAARPAGGPARVGESPVAGAPRRLPEADVIPENLPQGFPRALGPEGVSRSAPARPISFSDFVPTRRTLPPPPPPSPRGPIAGAGRPGLGRAIDDGVRAVGRPVLRVVDPVLGVVGRGGARIFPGGASAILPGAAQGARTAVTGGVLGRLFPHPWKIHIVPRWHGGGLVRNINPVRVIYRGGREVVTAPYRALTGAVRGGWAAARTPPVAVAGAPVRAVVPGGRLRPLPPGLAARNAPPAAIPGIRPPSLPRTPQQIAIRERIAGYGTIGVGVGALGLLGFAGDSGVPAMPPAAMPPAKAPPRAAPPVSEEARRRAEEEARRFAGGPPPAVRPPAAPGRPPVIRLPVIMDGGRAFITDTDGTRHPLGSIRGREIARRHGCDYDCVDRIILDAPPLAEPPPAARPPVAVAPPGPAPMPPPARRGDPAMPPAPVPTPRRLPVAGERAPAPRTASGPTSGGMSIPQINDFLGALNKMLAAFGGATPGGVAGAGGLGGQTTPPVCPPGYVAQKTEQRDPSILGLFGRTQTIYGACQPLPPAPGMPTADIRCAPVRAAVGETIAIAWECRGADAITATGFAVNGAFVGSREMTMEAPADGKQNRYTVLCTNGTGSAKKEATKSCPVQLRASVNPGEQVTVSWVPEQPRAGEQVLVNWAATDTVESCVVSSPAIPSLQQAGVRGSFKTPPAVSGRDIVIHFDCAPLDAIQTIRTTKTIRPL